MVKKKEHPGGGAKTSRSETVTVRLDPKLRYCAELAARKQRRTLSSFIEWAVQESLAYVELGEGFESCAPDTIKDMADSLWDVDEPDRFIKLVLRYPELLTHEEQVLWKLIRENDLLWKGFWHQGEWIWEADSLANLRIDCLREHWPTFVAVSRKEKERSALPKRERQQDQAPEGYVTETVIRDSEDEISD